MVRRVRRLAGLAVAALLTLGGVAAGAGTASAATLGSCSAAGVLATCAVTAGPSNPVTMTAAVTSSPDQKADVSWKVTCTQFTAQQSVSGDFAATTPFTHAVPHPYTRPDSCTVLVIASLDNGSGSIHLSVTWSSTLPVHLIRGYGGRCAGDNGNSSASGARIQTWACNSGDAAQSFGLTGGELTHNGKCLNDQAYGGSGSKVILYTCNKAPNELWTHNSRNEYVLKAGGGSLCLDDPAYSTRNGTQLIVYRCNNGANQHWTLP
jgi:hypothetical protein